jgi:outer membrane protein assembly factor BamB
MTCVMIYCCFSAISAIAMAGDWPQLLGPHRNGKADGEKLPERLPSAGLKELWQHPVGSGFAGPSVIGQKAIVFHRVGGNLVAEALDAAGGKLLWQRKFPTEFVSSISPDDGPRAAPVVDGNDVYLYGPDGTLRCLSLDDGSERWSRDTRQDFAPPEGYFGAGSSPLLEGDFVLLNVGGRKGSSIVAFHRQSGKTAWQSFDDAASYSSPIAVTIAGTRHAIFITRLNVVSLDPISGHVRFQFPFGKRGPTVNAANPVVAGDTLFVTASYGIGATAQKTSATAATQLWESDEVLSSQYVTPIALNGFLYGIDGRQDGPPARLRCAELKTGKVRWTEENFGTASLLLAGEKILALKVSGELVLFRAAPEKFEPLGTTTVSHSSVQALPALSNGRFFFRDEKLLHCLQLEPVDPPKS